MRALSQLLPLDALPMLAWEAECRLAEARTHLCDAFGAPFKPLDSVTHGKIVAFLRGVAEAQASDDEQLARWSCCALSFSQFEGIASARATLARCRSTAQKLFALVSPSGDLSFLQDRP